MDSEFSKKRALLLWQEGQKYHETGDLRKAIALYTKSISIHPTAESYTFRGWAYSFQGRIEEAIEECKKAIQVDPHFGNPYNDIGSYLITQGKIDEAVEWLIKAKAASRYELRHLPYMNLGKLYVTKGLLKQAILEFEKALELCPGEPNCMMTLKQIQRMMH